MTNVHLLTVEGELPGSQVTLEAEGVEGEPTLTLTTEEHASRVQYGPVFLAPLAAVRIAEHLLAWAVRQDPSLRAGSGGADPAAVVRASLRQRIAHLEARMEQDAVTQYKRGYAEGVQQSTRAVESVCRASTRADLAEVLAAVKRGLLGLGGS